MGDTVTIAYIYTDRQALEHGQKMGDFNYFAVFRPFALLARIFGIFPFSNVKIGEPSKLKCCSPLKLMTIIFGLLLIVELAIYLFRKLFMEVVDTENVLQLMTGLMDRVVGVVIYPVTWFRGHRYVGYFEKWQLVNYLLDQKAIVVLKKIRNVYLIALLLTIAVSLFTIIVLEEFTWTFVPGGLIVIAFIYPMAIVSRIVSIFSLCYVCVFYSLMAIHATVAFNRVMSRLRLALVVDGEIDVDREIRKLRFVHQQIFDLVEETNRVLSPLMVIYLSTQTVILCSLIYRMIVFKSDIVSMVTRGLYSMTKMALLISICITGGKVSDSSRDGLRVIHNAPLAYLSPEGRFQVHILEAKMSNRKAALNASGFADVNRSLLLQIAGVVVTYVLVMVQLNEDD